MMKQISDQRIPAVKNRRMALAVHYVLKACHTAARLFAPSPAPNVRQLLECLPDEPKILLIRTDGLGDLVMSSPFFEVLKRIYPGSKITLLAARWSRGVLPFLRGIDRCVFLDAPWVVSGSKGGWKEVADVIRSLRREKFDMTIDLRGDFRNNIIQGLIGSPIRLGFDITGCEFFLNGIIESGADEHSLHLARRIIDFLDPDAREGFDFLPRLHLPEHVIREARDVLAENGVPPGVPERPLVIVHPGARWSGRQWDPRKYAEISDRIVRQMNGRIIITGTGSELSVCEEVRRNMRESAVLLAGKTRFEIFLAILKSADLFIGVDSGPMHLAGAVGTPVLALFGPALARTVGPSNDPHAVVVSETKFDCAPCAQTVCLHPGHSCLDAISVEQVWEAICRLRHAGKRPGASARP